MRPRLILPECRNMCSDMVDLICLSRARLLRVRSDSDCRNVGFVSGENSSYFRKIERASLSMGWKGLVRRRSSAIRRCMSVYASYSACSAGEASNNDAMMCYGWETGRSFGKSEEIGLSTACCFDTL